MTKTSLSIFVYMLQVSMFILNSSDEIVLITWQRLLLASIYKSVTSETTSRWALSSVHHFVPLSLTLSSITRN